MGGEKFAFMTTLQNEMNELYHPSIQGIKEIVLFCY